MFTEFSVADLLVMDNSFPFGISSVIPVQLLVTEIVWEERP